MLATTLTVAAKGFLLILADTRILVSITAYTIVALLS